MAGWVGSVELAWREGRGTLACKSQPPNMAKKRKPQPLAPPPQASALRSRKRARQVTTLFHKYTQQRDLAIARAREGGCDVGSDEGDESVVKSQKSKCGSGGSKPADKQELLNEVKKWDDKIAEIGGREEYQRASQLNTSLFSTSKWVLGVLGRWGWLDGFVIPIDGDSLSTQKKRKHARRDIRLLEIGAINTQLLDAATRTKLDATTNESQRVHRLDVHAIDLRSTDPRIQKMDFFHYPLSDQKYDVLVCSMVINCVTTPAQRGTMLSLCFRHLRPGGVCFITLPNLCLSQSKFITRKYFEEILTKGVGFEMLNEVARESPKVAFFVLRRPEKDDVDGVRKWSDKFTRMPSINHGKKFRNTFAVILDKKQVDAAI